MNQEENRPMPMKHRAISRMSNARTFSFRFPTIGESKTMFKFDQNIALANAGASALNSKGCEITKEQLNKDFKGGEVPDLLETAALNLMDLANQGFCDRWTHSSMGEDIVAQRAAVQLAQNALQIIADIVEESAAEQVAHLNHQLALIGSKLPNNASYNDQQT